MAKELSRSAKKCDKAEKPEKAKIKKAIQKGNMKVNECASRCSGCQGPDGGDNGQGDKVSGWFGSVDDATLKTMNLEKISALMKKFKQHFETLDDQTQHMEDTMCSKMTLPTSQNQVDMLLQEMADEVGLDLSMELLQGQTGLVGTSVALVEQNELSQRLAHLQNQ
ncbi:hypothetical protein P7K49_032082, partial [Saguinus oedipus]